MRSSLPSAVALALIVVLCGAGAATSSHKKAPAKKAAAKSTASVSKSSAHPGKTAPARKSAARSGKAPSTSASAARHGKKAPAPRTTWRNRQTAPAPERYKEIQNALAAKGYLNPEESNGEWGQTSTDALKRFQSEQNLEPSGKINSLSLIALGLGPKHESPAASNLPAGN